MYIKAFDKWNNVKKRIQDEERKVHIRSGEIRWCTIGVNIGSEMDGKGESFSRPVLIIHTIGSKLALVIPLTSKLKSVAGYIPFTFQNKEHSLCVHQLKVISTKRLLKRKGRITRNRLEQVKKVIQEFYGFSLS